MEKPGLLPQAPLHRFKGEEPIGDSGKSVIDFWRWSSDLLENVQRGIFAEYVVATALGISDDTRVGWTGYDLLYGDHKVEVKSSAYVQSWKQRSLSKPTFGIGAREQWDEETGLFSDPRRVADVFVFCLFAHVEPSTANVLNLGQWQFFVLSTKTLTGTLPNAQTVTERRLRDLTSPIPYESLRERVDAVLADPGAFVNPQQIRLTESRARATEYTYAVAQRATRLHPVIVRASDYQEAFSRARADREIAALGDDISAVRLTSTDLESSLAAGARDLRT